MISRRLFLKYAAASGIGLLVPWGCTRDSGPAKAPLNSQTLAKYVDPLPRPTAMTPDTTAFPGFDYYRVSMTQFTQQLHRDLLPTMVWGYNGSFPGPTIEARSTLSVNTINPGRPVKVLYTNNLPATHFLPVDNTTHCGSGTSFCFPRVRAVVHLHGGHVGPESDGYPEAWSTPGNVQKGPFFNPSPFDYPNSQEAATLWYHDHTQGITRLNIYAGLAAFYIIRDDHEDSLNLPSGPYEIPLMIQDRIFHTDGSLSYPTLPPPPVSDKPVPSVVPEFFGDTILVNGMVWPFLEVEPRKYRFRILNASNSRFYNLFLSSGQTFTQIGTDGGLLNAPVPLDQLLLGPAERADVILDFSAFAGQTVLLRNDAATPFPDGDAPAPETTGQIMQFRVTKPLSGPDKSAIPGNLRPTNPIVPLTPTPTAPTRELLLIETDDQYGRIEPKLGTSADGALHWDHPVTETPNLNDTEMWVTINTTEDAHPIHLHLVQFQIVDRQAFDVDAYIPGQPATLRLLGRPIPPDANEAGWKDTARMPPGMVTRIIARFDIPGLYVWHCHILEHEDHEMMRPYRVITQPSP